MKEIYNRPMAEVYDLMPTSNCMKTTSANVVEVDSLPNITTGGVDAKSNDTFSE